MVKQNNLNKKVFVIKWGGAALAQGAVEQTKMIFKELAKLYKKGLLLAIVHGGGSEISNLCKRLHIPVQFKNGLRITDAATLDITQMILLGKINCGLVNALNQTGIKAIGLSGIDAGLIQVKKLDSKQADFGFVGEITHIKTSLLDKLLAENFLPVIAPLGIDLEGQIHNINADSVAGAIASVLFANKLIMLSDVDGFYADPRDPVTLLSRIRQREMKRWLQQRKISGGMIPKLQASLHALEHGVPCVQIINGNTPNSLSAAVYGKTVGTCILQER